MKQAWDAVKEETVVNCFRHCGMQATVAETTEDVFADLDEHEAQLEDLVEQLRLDDCMTASTLKPMMKLPLVLPLKVLRTGDRSCRKWWYQKAINQRGLMLKMRMRMLMKKVMKRAS